MELGEERCMGETDTLLFRIGDFCCSDEYCQRRIVIHIVGGSPWRELPETN